MDTMVPYITQDNRKEAHAGDAADGAGLVDPVVPSVREDRDPALGDEALDEDEHAKGKRHECEREMESDCCGRGEGLLGPTQGVFAQRDQCGRAAMRRRQGDVGDMSVGDLVGPIAGRRREEYTLSDRLHVLAVLFFERTQVAGQGGVLLGHVRGRRDL